MSVVNAAYKLCKGWWVRIDSACRCLRRRQFVLVCWQKAEDGQIDFNITHKGAQLSECIHRLGVDAVEILQDICDQEDALDEANKILE